MPIRSRLASMPYRYPISEYTETMSGQPSAGTRAAQVLPQVSHSQPTDSEWTFDSQPWAWRTKPSGTAERNGLPAMVHATPQSRPIDGSSYARLQGEGAVHGSKHMSGPVAASPFSVRYRPTVSTPMISPGCRSQIRGRV